MKKITLLLSALFIAAFSLTTTAQTYDVGCTAIPDPGNGATIYPNINLVTKFTIKNYAAEVSPAVIDSFVVVVEVAQTDITHYYYNGTFAVGAETTFDAPSSLDFSTMGLSAGNVSLCIGTQLWKNGVNVDANKSNDQFCIVLVYTGDSNPLTYDLGVSNIKVADLFNQYTDGSALPAGMTILEVLFDLTNASTTTPIPAGVLFDVIVEVDGVSSGSIPYIVNQPMSIGGSFTDVSIDALANGISLPSGKTSYDICVELAPSPDDINANNDKDCSSYTVVVGIDDVDDVEHFEMSYFNRNLTIDVLDNTTGLIDLNIMSVNGQKVYAESFNSNGSDSHEVDLSQLTSGVFIAIVVSEEGITETTRFVVE